MSHDRLPGTAADHGHGHGLEADDMGLAFKRLREALVYFLSRGERVETPIGTFADPITVKAA